MKKLITLAIFALCISAVYSCSTDSECDDSNVCTLNKCENGSCVDTNLSDSSCTTTTECSYGICDDGECMDIACTRNEDGLWDAESVSGGCTAEDCKSC